MAMLDLFNRDIKDLQRKVATNQVGQVNNGEEDRRRLHRQLNELELKVRSQADSGMTKRMAVGSMKQSLRQLDKRLSNLEEGGSSPKLSPERVSGIQNDGNMMDDSLTPEMAKEYIDKMKENRNKLKAQVNQLSYQPPNVLAMHRHNHTAPGGPSNVSGRLALLEAHCEENQSKLDYLTGILDGARGWNQSVYRHIEGLRHRSDKQSVVLSKVLATIEALRQGKGMSDNVDNEEVTQSSSISSYYMYRT